MNKIKRGVSLLLCSLLFGSAVTLGNVADVQAGKQIKTETKQTINNTKTKKKVSDDQTSGKTGRNEENKAGEGAQTDIAESKVTFFVLPVPEKYTTTISFAPASPDCPFPDSLFSPTFCFLSSVSVTVWLFPCFSFLILHQKNCYMP